MDEFILLAHFFAFWYLHSPLLAKHIFDLICVDCSYQNAKCRFEWLNSSLTWYTSKFEWVNIHPSKIKFFISLMEAFIISMSFKKESFYFNDNVWTWPLRIIKNALLILSNIKCLNILLQLQFEKKYLIQTIAY